MNTDRNGQTYKDVLDIQRAHLLVWKDRIRPQLFDQAEEFIVSQNREAPSANDKHRVYRGGDIIEILRQWPDLDAVYRPVVEPKTVSPSELI